MTATKVRAFDASRGSFEGTFDEWLEWAKSPPDPEKAARDAARMGIPLPPDGINDSMPAGDLLASLRPKH